MFPIPIFVLHTVNEIAGRTLVDYEATTRTYRHNIVALPGKRGDVKRSWLDVIPLVASGLYALAILTVAIYTGIISALGSVRGIVMIATVCRVTQVSRTQ